MLQHYFCLAVDMYDSTIFPEYFLSVVTKMLRITNSTSHNLWEYIILTYHHGICKIYYIQYAYFVPSFMETAHNICLPTVYQKSSYNFWNCIFNWEKLITQNLASYIVFTLHWNMGIKVIIFKIKLFSIAYYTKQISLLYLFFFNMFLPNCV